MESQILENLKERMKKRWSEKTDPYVRQREKDFKKGQYL